MWCVRLWPAYLCQNHNTLTDKKMIVRWFDLAPSQSSSIDSCVWMLALVCLLINAFNFIRYLPTYKFYVGKATYRPNAQTFCKFSTIPTYCNSTLQAEYRSWQQSHASRQISGKDKIVHHLLVARIVALYSRSFTSHWWVLTVRIAVM